MYFRAQRKTSGEVHLGDAIEIDKDGNPLTLQDVIRDERDMEQELEQKFDGKRCAATLKPCRGAGARDFGAALRSGQSKTADSTRSCAAVKYQSFLCKSH